MRITAPITDYIPQSILTTLGDLAVRGAVIPERLAAGADGTFLKGKGAGVLPAYGLLDGLSKYYLKGQGIGTESFFAKLALSDTGTFIGKGVLSASGSYVVSGVGFEPSIVILIASDDTGSNLNWSLGFDNGTLHANIHIYDNGAGQDTDENYSIMVRRDASNLILSAISAKGSDGFTLTSTETGACLLNFLYLCLP